MPWPPIVNKSTLDTRDLRSLIKRVYATLNDDAAGNNVEFKHPTGLPNPKLKVPREVRISCSQKEVYQVFRQKDFTGERLTITVPFDNFNSMSFAIALGDAMRSGTTDLRREAAFLRRMTWAQTFAVNQKAGTRNRRRNRRRP